MSEDSHDRSEGFRLLSHRLYAEAIDSRPELLSEARALIDHSLASGTITLGERMWRALLTMPRDDVKRAMLHDGPEGRLLRANSPFSQLLGITNPERREALWLQANSAQSA